jgi:hypothetical protein
MGFQIGLAKLYFSVMALVANAPRIAQTTTVTGPEIS